MPHVFESDFSDVTVVTLYLLPELNLRLLPKLLKDLKPGTRIVSHAFMHGQLEARANAGCGRTFSLFLDHPRARQAWLGDTTRLRRTDA